MTFKSKALWSAALFTLLLIVYLDKGDFLPGNDARGNVHIPVSLFNDGNLSFSPDEFPDFFLWKFKDSKGRPYGAPFKDWETQVNGQSPQKLLEESHLRAKSYFLVETRHKGVYAKTFGIGAGLTGVPVFALSKIIGGEPETTPRLIQYAGKFTASMLVAGSAVLVFF